MIRRGGRWDRRSAARRAATTAAVAVAVAAYATAADSMAGTDTRSGFECVTGGERAEQFAGGSP